jgi:hypothetical protein
LSFTSSAFVRTTNQKESKEKKNREKLLAGPGSEFSLANAEDFEMDYYDYNVINAGAAPGSYLGMVGQTIEYFLTKQLNDITLFQDPAFLVWIPPIDEGNIINEMEDQDDEPYYEEILPNYEGLDPGSNAETPDENIPQIPVKPPRKTVIDNPKPFESNKLVEEDIKFNSNGKKRELNLSSKTLTRQAVPENAIQMKEFSNNKDSENHSIIVATSSLTPPMTLPNLNKTIDKQYSKEKETAVVKSPSDNKLNDFYELSDIQFADDEDAVTPTANDNQNFNVA